MVAEGFPFGLLGEVVQESVEGIDDALIVTQRSRARRRYRDRVPTSLHMHVTVV
jgi:hypothetical protein